MVQDGGLALKPAIPLAEIRQVPRSFQPVEVTQFEHFPL